MAQMIKGNYNALMWLQDELQQSLTHALNAMNSYIDGEAQEKTLSDCIEALYQVKGTLDMVNISGGAMLADEMQQTAIALRNGNVENRDHAQDALVRALLLFPNYLKLLSEDFQDHPLALLESFNELRQARQAEELTELALFKPILSVALPESVAPNPLRKRPEIALEQHKLGHAFQVILLSWLRQQDKESLRKMRGIVHYLRLSCQEEKTTLLWWSAETVLEALEQDGLTANADIKQLLGKLVMPIKTQSEQNEAALLQTLPTDLITRLLLVTAKAQSHGPLETLLKTTFNLHFFDHQQKIYGMSDNALGDAHLALLEQLEELKTQIDHYNPDQDLDAASIEGVVHQLQSMTDTLALLAEYEASNLLHHQADRLQAIVDDGKRPDEEALTELADVLLQVEKFIQASTQANVNNQLRDTVMGECLLEMANIKETLTLMSQAQRHPDELGETEQQLSLMAGSMDMLNYSEAADILRQTTQKIVDQSNSHEAFTPTQLNRLADILACCDIYMEGIRQHGHAESDYLADAEDKLARFDEEETPEELEVSTSENKEPVDPALAELDSLLADEAESLVYETEPDEQAAISEAESQSPVESSETITFESAYDVSISLPDENQTESHNEAIDTTLPDSEEWQFTDDVDPEIAEVFIEEANEVLTELDTLMPQWLNQQNPDALDDIRRHFHTLKGSGRMAGASVIGELAWDVEQVLNRVLDGTRQETPQIQRLTSESHQLIPSLLVRFTQANNSSMPQVDALHALKETCLAEEAPAHVAPEDKEPEAVEQHAAVILEEQPNFAEDSDENLVVIEPEEDPSLVEFDVSAYQHADDAEETLDTSVEPEVAPETDVLTGVEKYIRDQQQQADTAAVVEPEQTSPKDTLTGVERYICAQDQSPAVSTVTFEESASALTSVEKYIRDQQQQADTAVIVEPEQASPKDTLTGVGRFIHQRNNETGVARYIRLNQAFAKEPAPLEAEVEVSEPAPVRPQYQPLTSVDHYLIRQARKELEPTGVDRYLAMQDAKLEADTIAAEEDDELLQIFASEAAQHIVNLKQGLQEIDFSRQMTKPLLRAVHSLKGCANIAGIKPMGLIATELDAAMKQLHAQDSVLNSEQMSQLQDVIEGLDNILNSIIRKQPEPNIQELSAVVAALTPEAETESAPIIDPEFLVVFLEETDELLDDYIKQLAQWQQQPGNEDNLQALGQTLYDLEQAAKQAEQQQIADVYAALAKLIKQRQPGAPGLDALLEQGYEQLNQHIESLLQNKVLKADFDFAERVATYLASQTDTSPAPTTHADIDETEFQLPADVDPELLDAFCEEAGELLTSSGQSIKSWQSERENQVDPLQLQRDLHTLKGGARLTGITPMADLTHQVETLVLAVSNNKQPANEDFFDLLQRCQDKLSEMQEQLSAQQPVQTAVSLIEEIITLTKGEDVEVDDRPLPEPEKIQPNIAETLAKTAAAEAPASNKPSAPVEQVRVRADLLDYLTNFAGEVSIARDRVTQQHTALRQQLHEMEETVSRLHDQLRKLEIETETQILFRYEDERLKNESDFDPLELDRFSMIQQLSRGLTESVIDLNDISHSMDTLVKETDAILLQQSRLNTDLQEGLMATRLLPFSGIVPRLERIVRQTATELDKKADFNARGAELELDRTILDRLVAPLEHILRNAIAHGLEAPGERLANGKQEQGQLGMNIIREGSEMVITISDDGCGIDVEKVKQKALSLNLIEADNVPPEDELIQLILTSGFSTADNVSQVAGRGVGMDVVSNEIRSLKGRLTINSERGQGTSFVIRLPLTLSVIQALLVRVQDEQYAVPLGSVNAGERISVRDIKLMLGTHNPKYEFNGEQYDFVPLASLLDKPLTLPTNLKHQLPLLLFRSGEIRIALLVDNILSNREIVIKSVGKQLGSISAINGATILGDGRVVFILDIPTLIDSSKDLQLDSDNALSFDNELTQLQEQAPTAMVVDDSITMRKASGNLLKRLGFEVMTARDGVDALSQLHEQKPDIILLDVEMPRMDGFEFASIVRNDNNFRHLPIIMITSRTGQKHRERAMEIGVNAYLGKPYQENELVTEMQKLLAGNRFPGQLS